MNKLTLKFIRLSAVIVLSFCMLCANNIKIYAQGPPTFTVYAPNGNVGEAVIDAMLQYIIDVDENFNPFLYPLAISILFKRQIAKYNSIEIIKLQKFIKSDVFEGRWMWLKWLSRKSCKELIRNGFNIGGAVSKVI